MTRKISGIAKEKIEAIQLRHVDRSKIKGAEFDNSSITSPREGANEGEKKPEGTQTKQATPSQPTLSQSQPLHPKQPQLVPTSPRSNSQPSHAKQAAAVASTNAQTAQVTKEPTPEPKQKGNKKI